MLYEWIGYILGVVVGVAVGLLIQWGIHRRLLSLEYRQADLETNLLTEKRKRAIQTRYARPGSEQEVMEFLEKGPTQRRGFANDPDYGVPGELR